MSVRIVRLTTRSGATAEYVPVLDGSERGLPVAATSTDVRRWERVTAEYVRVQREMAQLYHTAEKSVEYSS